MTPQQHALAERLDSLARTSSDAARNLRDTSLTASQYDAWMDEVVDRLRLVAGAHANWATCVGVRCDGELHYADMPRDPFTNEDVELGECRR